MGYHFNAYVPIPRFLEWIGIIISFASVIPLFVSMSTQKWLTYQELSNNMTKEYDYGLWEFCLYENCMEIQCGAIIDTPQAVNGNTINYLGAILILIGGVFNLIVFFLECCFLTDFDIFLLNFVSILATAMALSFTSLGLAMYVNQVDKIIEVKSFEYGFGLACCSIVLLLVLLLIGIIRAQSIQHDAQDESSSERKKQVYWKEILLILLILVWIITLAFAVISLATNHWLHHKSETNKCKQYYYGLWRYCLHDKTIERPNIYKCDNLKNIPSVVKLSNNNNPRFSILLAVILHFTFFPLFYFLYKNIYVKSVTIALAITSFTSFVLSVVGISVLTERWKDSDISFGWEYSYVFGWIATFGYLLHGILSISYRFAPDKPTETRKPTLSISSQGNPNGNRPLPQIFEPEFTIPTYIIDPFDITESPNMVHKGEVAQRAKERAEKERVEKEKADIEKTEKEKAKKENVESENVERGQIAEETENEWEYISDDYLDIVKEIEDIANEN